MTIAEDFWQINWQSRPFIDFYCLSMIDFLMARKQRSELKIQKKKLFHFTVYVRYYAIEHVRKFYFYNESLKWYRG